MHHLESESMQKWRTVQKSILKWPGKSRAKGNNITFEKPFDKQMRTLTVHTPLYSITASFSSASTQFEVSQTHGNFNGSDSDQIVSQDYSF